MTDTNSAVALDEAIGRAMRGESDGDDVIGLMVTATLVVPSGAEVGERFEGFQPLLFDRDGTTMLGVFTSLELAGGVADVAPYALTLTGRDVLRMMPADHGLAVNPGHRAGFELPPSGVVSLRESLEKES